MMEPGPEKLARIVRELTRGGSTRPKPGAAFLKAVAEYVKASRRLAAAQEALLAHMDAYEDEVWAAGAGTPGGATEATPFATEPGLQQDAQATAGKRLDVDGAAAGTSGPAPGCGAATMKRIPLRIN